MKSDTEAATNYDMIKAPTGASDKWNILNTISICPAYKTVCAAPTKVGAAVVDASNRTVKLAATGDATVLAMNTTPDAKNFKRESCSYVVQVACGAPVVHIATGSTAAGGQWELYF